MPHYSRTHYLRHFAMADLQTLQARFMATERAMEQVTSPEVLEFAAGKMTGLRGYKEKFNKKQKELENKGHTVINPVGLYEVLGIKLRG